MEMRQLKQDLGPHHPGRLQELEQPGDHPGEVGSGQLGRHRRPRNPPQCLDQEPEPGLD